MHWDAIGAVGEILGALAVVLSLGYLAVQIRQNTRVVRSSQFHAITDSFNRVNTAIATDERLARIYRTGMQRYDFLDEDQRTQFDFLFLSALRIFEVLYYQAKLGTGERELWEAEQATIAALLKTPGGLTWWRQNPLSLTPEFRAHVDGLLEAGEPGATLG